MPTLLEATDAVGQRRLVDHPIGQAELVLECVGDRVGAGGNSHG